MKNPKKPPQTIITLKKFLQPIKKEWIKNEKLLHGYLIALSTKTDKHSLKYAEQLTKIHNSQFSRWLKTCFQESKQLLVHLAKKLIEFSIQNLSSNNCITAKLPWKAYLIIDSTPQRRSDSQAENISKLNLGGGFWLGHRFTNIVLFINGNIIPLPPIPYFSKKYCKINQKEHKTEPTLICEYLDQLKLEEFIPKIEPKEVLVLLDAGYDVKDIQNKILSKQWNFISALKCSRNIQMEVDPHSYGSPILQTGVKDLFRRFKRPAQIVTCKLKNLHGKTKRKKITVRRLHGRLKEVGESIMTVLATQIKKKHPVKYLISSQSGLPTWMIVQAFAIRFYIECFHKVTKQSLGFEDVATHSFESVQSHTNLVYCAYILFGLLPHPHKSIAIKQALFTQQLRVKEVKKIIQISTQFNWRNRIKEYYQKLQDQIAA